MIKNDTLLEQLFYEMYMTITKNCNSGNKAISNSMLDILEQKNEKDDSINLITDINFNKIYCLMHYMDNSNNPEHICQFVLEKRNYYDKDGNCHPFTQKHKEQLQKFCDLFEKNGFKFIVRLENNMSLLWSKDGKIIDKNNFNIINSILELNKIVLPLEKYCKLKNITRVTFQYLKKQKKIPHKIVKIEKKHKKQFIIINPYKIIEIKSDNGIII